MHKLKLKNLPSLIMGRMLRIEELEKLIVLWLKESRLDYKKLLAETIEEACSDDVEYTEALRQFAESRGFPAPPEWA